MQRRKLHLRYKWPSIWIIIFPCQILHETNFRSRFSHFSCPLTFADLYSSACACVLVHVHSYYFIFLRVFFLFVLFCLMMVLKVMFSSCTKFITEWYLARKKKTLFNSQKNERGHGYRVKAFFDTQVYFVLYKLKSISRLQLN